MPRNNQSSIRYSDEVAEIINNYPVGESFADKFENLVLFCYNKLPELNEIKLDLLEQIDEAKKEIEEVTIRLRTVRSIERELIKFSNIQRDLYDILQENINKIKNM